MFYFIFFFKQKTAYEMRISDWSSDVCSSDLGTGEGFRVEASWQHRNFFPPEGAMTFRGVVGTQEQSLSAIYRRNNFLHRDQVLNGQVSASNINRSAYDARTFQISGRLEQQTNIIFQKTWKIGRAHVVTPVHNTNLVCRT